MLCQHYNYIAPMIQLHYEVTWCPTVTRCRHPRQMSITEMTVCHASVRRNKLTLLSPWLKSGGHDIHGNLNGLHISCPLCVSPTQFTCCGEQSRPDEGRRLTGETSHYEEEFGTVSLTMGKQKALLSPPVGGLFFIFFSVGLLWWIIALLTWFHNAVTRLSVPV